MKLLVERSTVHCDHDGRIPNVPRQQWVRVDGSPVLVDDDPEGRSIIGCPNFGATMKPCVKTLKVQHGYRDWIRVDGHRVTLDDLDGLTDGTLPGTVHYKVRRPGQLFVEVNP